MVLLEVTSRPPASGIDRCTVLGPQTYWPRNSVVGLPTYPAPCILHSWAPTVTAGGHISVLKGLASFTSVDLTLTVSVHHKSYTSHYIFTLRRRPLILLSILQTSSSQDPLLNVPSSNTQNLDAHTQRPDF